MLPLTSLDIAMTKMNHALGSSRAATASLRFHATLSDGIPVTLCITLDSALNFSPALRNFALAIVSGSKSRSINPQMTAVIPRVWFCQQGTPNLVTASYQIHPPPRTDRAHDMSKRPRKQIRDRTTAAVPGIPIHHPTRCLFSRVPHRSDVQESRRDSCLQSTSQESRDEELCVSIASSCNPNHNSPTYEHHTNVLRNRQSLDQDRTRVVPGEVAKVEHCGNDVVAIPLQILSPKSARPQ